MKKVLKKILFAVVAIIVICVVVLSFYVHNVISYFYPDDSFYYSRLDGTDIYVFFDMDNDKFVIISSDEYRTAFSKTTYSIEGNFWNHLFGPLYFRSNSLLSITSAKDVPLGAKPATVYMHCSESYYVMTYDEDVGMERQEDFDVEGENFTSIFYFCDDGIVLDGIEFKKVDAVESVLAELVRLFIG